MCIYIYTYIYIYTQCKHNIVSRTPHHSLKLSWSVPSVLSQAANRKVRDGVRNSAVYTKDKAPRLAERAGKELDRYNVGHPFMIAKLV